MSANNMNAETEKLKKPTSKRNTYSKQYYQKNKQRFQQYYQNYKLKKKQIADGTYVPPPKEEKPKRSKQEIIENRFQKIHQKYLERRAKWLEDNGRSGDAV